MYAITNELIEMVKQNKRQEVYFIYNSGDKEKRRLFLSSDNRVCVFNRGSGRYGSSLTSYEYELKDIIPIQKKQINYSVVWLKAMHNMRDRLKKSGLWSDYLQDIELALSIGYEKLQQIRKIEERRINDLSYDDNRKNNLEEIKKIEPRLIKVGEHGEYLNTQIVWYLAYIPKIKKMYFGKYDNERILQQIKEGLKNNQDFNLTGRASYDVSFSYRADLKKAWYSEEYKNCGNGHYYLALDNTHAWFYEDD